jgi:hypothetical protein
MVKDSWDQSPVSVISHHHTTNQSLNQKQNFIMVVVDKEEASIDAQQKSALQTKEAINNNDTAVWGGFVSRENFIEMHIC